MLNLLESEFPALHDRIKRANWMLTLNWVNLPHAVDYTSYLVLLVVDSELPGKLCRVVAHAGLDTRLLWLQELLELCSRVGGDSKGCKDLVAQSKLGHCRADDSLLHAVKCHMAAFQDLVSKLTDWMLRILKYK